jgi:hypothetical protein
MNIIIDPKIRMEEYVSVIVGNDLGKFSEIMENQTEFMDARSKNIFRIIYVNFLKFLIDFQT